MNGLIFLTKNFRVNRAFGGDCYYLAANGHIGAGPGTGRKPGQGGDLHGEPAPLLLTSNNLCSVEIISAVVGF
jgi:hypothetical protein